MIDVARSAGTGWDLGPMDEPAGFLAEGFLDGLPEGGRLAWRSRKRPAIAARRSHLVTAALPAGAAV